MLGTDAKRPKCIAFKLSKGKLLRQMCGDTNRTSCPHLRRFAPAAGTRSNIFSGKCSGRKMFSSPLRSLTTTSGGEHFAGTSGIRARLNESNASNVGLVFYVLLLLRRSIKPRGVC